MDQIRTALAGGSPLLQAGMVAALGQDARLSVVSQLRDPSDVISSCDRPAWDVLILNAEAPRVEAAPVVANLANRAATTRVLVLTGGEDYEEILATLLAGVHGYGIHTTLSPEDLCNAVIALAQFGVWMCPRTTRCLMSAVLQKATIAAFPGDRDAPLSHREFDVLRRAAAGEGEERIAEELCLSRNTVKTYLRRIREKLQAGSRAEAVSLALERGLLLKPGLERAAHPVAQNGSECHLRSPGPTSGFSPARSRPGAVANASGHSVARRVTNMGPLG